MLIEAVITAAEPSNYPKHFPSGLNPVLAGGLPT
jgi:hypothetical protein